MGKRDNGSVCLGDKLFTCSNYGMWNKLFPYRLCFWNPHFVLDTLRSKSVTVIVLEPYVPIGYAWHGMISYVMLLCVYVDAVGGDSPEAFDDLVYNTLTNQPGAALLPCGITNHSKSRSGVQKAVRRLISLKVGIPADGDLVERRHSVLTGKKCVLSPRS